MIKIGLTGGIGSGKSSIAMVFETFGYPVFYSDIEAKKLMVTKLRQPIINLLGSFALNENGQLNKKAIGDAIFNDAQLITKLNSIVHPAVGVAFHDWCDQQNSNIVIEEAALLIESGAYKDMDKIIVAVAPLDARIKRTCRRDNLTENQVMAKIANQVDQKIMTSHADFIVDTYNEFITCQVIDILKKVLPLQH